MPGLPWTQTATAVGADQRAAGNHGDLVPARRKERRRPVYRINREAERIHEADQVLILVDGLRIPIGDIVELESE